MEGDLDIAAGVGPDMSSAYWRVAKAKCSPGTPKKTMDDIVAKAFGIQPWRARAMRLGEAGCFSAAAYKKVQDSLRDMMQRRADAFAENARARAQKDRAELEAARCEFRTQLERIEIMLARLDAAGS